MASHWYWREFKTTEKSTYRSFDVFFGGEHESETEPIIECRARGEAERLCGVLNGMQEGPGASYNASAQDWQTADVGEEEAPIAEPMPAVKVEPSP